MMSVLDEETATQLARAAISMCSEGGSGLANVSATTRTCNNQFQRKTGERISATSISMKNWQSRRFLEFVSS